MIEELVRANKSHLFQTLSCTTRYHIILQKQMIGACGWPVNGDGQLGIESWEHTPVLI